DCLTARTGLGDGVAVQEDCKRPGVSGTPVGDCHLRAARRQPDNVAQCGLIRPGRLPAEEPAPPEDRMLAAKRGERAGELWQADLSAGGRLLTPVDPGDLVVLAVGVVVAPLGAAKLVACQQHGDAL